MSLLLLTIFMCIIPVSILWLRYTQAIKMITLYDKGWRQQINVPAYIIILILWSILIIISYISYIINKTDLQNFIPDCCGPCLLITIFLGIIWYPIFFIVKSILLKSLQIKFCEQFFKYNDIRERYVLFINEIHQIIPKAKIYTKLIDESLILYTEWMLAEFGNSEQTHYIEEHFYTFKFNSNINITLGTRYEDFGTDTAKIIYYDLQHIIKTPSYKEVSPSIIKMVLNKNCGIVI